MTTRTASSTKDMPMLMTEQPEHALPARRLTASPRRRRHAHVLAFAAAIAVVAVPLAAEAQRKSPLAGAPAIRKRFELRSARLEIGGGVGTTINQDFYHSVLISLRAGFHITDWLSIAGFADLAAANLETGFQSRVVGSLNEMPVNGMLMREPTQAEATASMQKINNILGAQLEFTPFTGKYSLAGKLFAAYDFYVFVGPGFISVKPTGGNPVDNCSGTTTGYSCGVSGLKFGANFGVGMHSFFTQWLAFNIELRDILAQLNPSGRDVNADQRADNNDLTWTHTYMLTGNLVFYLPTTASISQ
jgi:outer membrane beta-barrel protein